MKAERDDAPKHVKHKRKSPIRRAGIAAAGLIAGILFMADRNGWVNYAKHMVNPPSPSDYQTAATSPRIEKPPATLQPASPKAEEVPQKSTETVPAIKQTSFNDSNYRPSTTINTMPPPAPKYAQARSQPRSSRQPQGLNGSHTVRLTWGNGSWWQGTYRWSNSIINYDDLCRSSNYPRKGSIEYRTCRREAKTYLRDECRAGRSKSLELRRVYCHAENAFRH